MADDSFEPQQFRDRPRNRRGRNNRGGFVYRRKDESPQYQEYSRDGIDYDERPRRNQYDNDSRPRYGGRGRGRGRNSRQRRRGREQNGFYEGNDDDNVSDSREPYGNNRRPGGRGRGRGRSRRKSGRGRGRGRGRDRDRDRDRFRRFDDDEDESALSSPSRRFGRFQRSSNAFGGRHDEFEEQPPPVDESSSTQESHGNFFNGDDAPNGDDDDEFMTLELLKPSERKAYLIKNIRRRRYDCGICQDRIVRRRPIWSCRICFNVFHLDCISTWVNTNEVRAAEAAGRSIRPIDQIHDLKCPLCLHPHTDFEAKYFCYCGKFQNPYDDRSNLPHSCGEPCERSRGRYCSHPCEDVCHPGPCDPCTRISDRIGTCPCGKQSFQMACSQDEVDSAQVCGQICDKVLTCGNHRCTKKCHTGPCETCELTEMQTCFCGKHTREGQCGSGQPIEQEDGSIVTSFSCENVCGKRLACGNHECTMTCHAGSCVSCRRKVRHPTMCACGKTEMEDAPERTDCMDPLPECDEKCDRMLACGKHFCDETCHDSPCPKCKVKIRKKCRCGKQRIQFECEEFSRLEQKQLEEQDDGKIAENPVRCRHVCKQIKTCGVHKCGTRCCPGKRIQNYLGHICDVICNKMLECGNHRCLRRCHVGPCQPCDVILRHGIRCACGSEWLPGPVPCGTRPPDCYNYCPNMLECGHPCAKRCHLDECSRCTISVRKACTTHGVEMDVPCFVERVSCGQICGQALSCGFHKCTRSCHPGRCDEKRRQGQSCGQTCSKTLPCGHKCREKCHPNQACPKELCNHSMVISCICGNRHEQERCRGRNKQTIPAIPCTDSCKIAERNRRFREAFDIDESANGARQEALEYSSDMMKGCLRVVDSRPGFLKEIESILSNFVGGRPLKTNKNAIVAGSVLDLQCSHPDERFVIFSILPHYHMTGETVRTGRKTSMAIRKNERSLVPSVTLSQALVKYRSDPDSVVTLENAPPQQMIVIDNVREIDDSQIQDQLVAWEGHYRMWRSQKSEQLFLVFVNEELRNSALTEIRHFGARGGEVEDSAEAVAAKKRNQKANKRKKRDKGTQPGSTTTKSVDTGWTKPKRTANKPKVDEHERLDVVF